MWYLSELGSIAMASNHDLATTFLGIELDSPVIVGSCPLTMEPETVRQLADAGAGAVVLPSLFPHQLDPAAATRTPHAHLPGRRSGEEINFERYIATIKQLKSLRRCPVFASISADAAGDWINQLPRLQAAGADAIELSWYLPLRESHQSSQQIEDRLCQLVETLCRAVSIPVAVKLSQRFTSLASVSRSIEAAGAAGVVLFTHTPHWDISIDRMDWRIRWELSPSGSLAGILEGILRARTGALTIPIAASGGVCCGEDAIKAMLAGAAVVMVASEIYRSGPAAIANIIAAASQYLARSSYDSLRSMQVARPSLPQYADLLLPPEYSDPRGASGRPEDSSRTQPSDAGNGFGHVRQ